MAVLEIPIKSAVVSAEGDVDLRGTLGVTEGVPVGFKEIRLRFDIETDAPQAQLDQLVELTDRYQGQTEQTRHEILFRGYRKFGAEVKIIDVDEKDFPPDKPEEEPKKPENAPVLKPPPVKKP